jgi:hypothetical protein
MATMDMYNVNSPSSSIRAQAVTATLNGTGVDLQGFEGALVLLDLGLFGGTTPTATIKIQESDDNTTFTDVAAADLLGGVLPAIDTTNDETTYERGYIGRKRYIRVAVTAIAGTSPSLPTSAVVVRGGPRKQPV